MGRRIRAAQERREMRLANARAEREMVAELEALKAVLKRDAPQIPLRSISGVTLDEDMRKVVEAQKGSK